MKTTIKKWGINGEGIAYINRKPVFIPFVIPNETIEFHITEQKETYAIGELDRIIEASSKRRYPLCPIWKECGGCALMHTKYKEQARMKEEMVRESLYKYTGYKGRVLPVMKNPEPLNYRNTCKLPLRRILGIWESGMYEKDSQTFVPLHRCYVHSRGIERVRQSVMDILNEYPEGEYQTLVLREFDEKIQIILVTGPMELVPACIEKLGAIDAVVSLWQSIKTEDSVDVYGETMRHLYGTENMELTLHDFHLQLLPRSFFQLNTKQADALYQIVSEWTPRSHTIVEAYSGIGAISLYVKDKAKQIIGIEYVADAVENANNNAKRNHCEHIRFVRGDAAKKLQEITEPVDTLIVDPPRSGLDEAMKQTILKKQIPTIIYVSCNPSTLAKDLNTLKTGYTIRKVQPVDMFSQTPLVEAVVLLTRKTTRLQENKRQKPSQRRSRNRKRSAVKDSMK